MMHKFSNTFVIQKEEEEKETEKENVLQILSARCGFCFRYINLNLSATSSFSSSSSSLNYNIPNIPELQACSHWRGEIKPGKKSQDLPQVHLLCSHHHKNLKNKEESGDKLKEKIKEKSIEIPLDKHIKEINKNKTSKGASFIQNLNSEQFFNPNSNLNTLCLSLKVQCSKCQELALFQIHPSTAKIAIPEFCKTLGIKKIPRNYCLICQGKGKVPVASFSKCENCEGTGGIICLYCCGAQFLISYGQEDYLRFQDRMMQCCCDRGFSEICQVCCGTKAQRNEISDSIPILPLSSVSILSLTAVPPLLLDDLPVKVLSKDSSFSSLSSQSSKQFYASCKLCSEFHALD